MSGSAATGAVSPSTCWGRSGNSRVELAADRAQRLTESLDVQPPNQLLEGIHERAVRPAYHRVARAVQDERVGRGLVSEFTNQAALARARLPTDQREAQRRAVRARDERPQNRQFARAARERKRRGQPKLTWQLRHRHHVTPDSQI